MRLSRILVPSAVFLVFAGISRSSQATNICGETVAANRMVDGIPAYSQCAATTSSAIYSNNGVDTSTTSGGTDWVRTQMSAGYQCTELTHRYLYFKWNVQGVPSGNAGTWCDGTIPSGLVKASTPMHGDLIVFAPGSCGADATTGHVAVIDVVNTNSTVTFVEQNSAGRRSCANSTAACFLHATANAGIPIDGGIPDSGEADSGPAVNDDANMRADAAADRGRFDATGAGGATGTGGATGAGGTVGTGGSGGVIGTGGAMATGGGHGTGGVTGLAGTSGAGGTIAGSGGNTGTTSAPNTAPAASSSNGCSCRLTAPSTQGRLDGWDALFMLALAAGLVISRRRAWRRRPRT
jgi:surface antigen